MTPAGRQVMYTGCDGKQPCLQQERVQHEHPEGGGQVAARMPLLTWSRWRHSGLRGRRGRGRRRSRSRGELPAIAWVMDASKHVHGVRLICARKQCLVLLADARGQDDSPCSRQLLVDDHCCLLVILVGGALQNKADFQSFPPPNAARIVSAKIQGKKGHVNLEYLQILQSQPCISKPQKALYPGS